NDDAVIFGLSKDTIKSHKKFETKKNLEITLLSNPELNVLRDYKAWGLKKSLIFKYRIEYNKQDKSKI
ncbi:MAG TPA: redoxin domain-containing protein, partial [Candidatus Altiarchaeales archaeon]|nr:redoxin domain-containing protein [Candidatus Altiarchaeales archaeon]